jgi:hypothetical protein
MEEEVGTTLIKIEKTKTGEEGGSNIGGVVGFCLYLL